MVMEDFQDLLEAHSGIAAEDQEVFVGEPPEPLKASIALWAAATAAAADNMRARALS